jgi:Sulfotransferase family
MRKYVFVHLPKTGGTSFQLALRRVIGDDAVSPSFNASILSEAEAGKLDQYPVISGHISITDVARYFPDRKILTILRDPLDRCVSWYYFARLMPQSTSASSDVLAAQHNDIEGFFSQSEQVIYRNIFNRQVRQLGDHVLNLEANHGEAFETAKETLRLAAWVGLQENLAADCAKLAHIFPEATGLCLQWSNPTLGKTAVSKLGPKLLESIKRFNVFDMALYKFARAEICSPDK